MKKISYIAAVCLIALTVLGLASCQNESANSAEYRALIITGQNNHTWEASTPILKQILDNSGLFNTIVAKSPEKGADMSSFTPEFADYDLVVLDYNGDHWPEETQQAFLDFVSGGGGVVVYHAADNAFADWEEYNKIIGLGGWGQRNETNGPYIRFKDDKFVKDYTPGRGGSHGRQHAFVVTIREENHPITDGLPREWLHARDELYSELRGPAENLNVLATAYADTATGGTGEHEPALMTIEYGSGRVFHTTLGHVGGMEGPYPAAECVGFIVTLQRGAEWAVSGQVTQAIPEDFPGYNTLSLWPNYRPLELDEILDNLVTYKEGDNNTSLQALIDLIRITYQIEEEWVGMQAGLLTFLKGDATSDAKNFICRQLSQFGNEDCVATLEKLSKEEDTQEMARFALERITGNYTNK